MGENITSLANIIMKNYLNQQAYEGSCCDMHRQDSMPGLESMLRS